MLLVLAMEVRHVHPRPNRAATLRSLLGQVCGQIGATMAAGCPRVVAHGAPAESALATQCRFAHLGIRPQGLGSLSCAGRTLEA